MKLGTFVRRTWRPVSRVGAFSVLMIALGGIPVAAQQIADPDVPHRPVDDPFTESTVDLDRASPFNISGLGDFARTGVINTGTNRFCYGNTAPYEPYFALGCEDIDQYQTAFGTIPMFFEISYALGAPPSDLPPPAAQALEDGVLRGEGYTMEHNNYILTGDQVWRGSDRSGAELLAFGVTATSDGSCRDYTANQSGEVDPGIQLLPANICEPTWPGGEWGGNLKYNLESVLAAQEQGLTGDDPFAFWRIPDELRDDAFLGNWATFGEVNDYAIDLLPDYGSIIPGQDGEPIRDGWPLGIDMFFDGFYFNLPTVNNAYFFEITIVNNSERVWGEGVTYDSLYAGLLSDVLVGTQNGAVYTDPARGGWLFNNPGSGVCTSGTPPSPPGSGCGGNFGFAAGAGGILVLKSPIGDLRNKLLTDESSPFYDPTSPLADDTITFNHQHMCGFGGCWANNIARSPRSAFGMWSSTAENVLDGRAAGDLADRTMHRTFRSENWPGPPDQVARFNRYVPGGWDYNEDGVQDTLYVDNCGADGCVELWSDTLPSGYVNSYANISTFGLGPFRLEPGDTAGWIMALVTAPDEPSFEGLVNNVISFYQEFYFGPEAPDPVQVVSSDVQAGGITDNQISIFLDDTADEFVDPFIQKFASDVESADPASELGKLRALNPWLVDSLRLRAGENIVALHVFKSCDGGDTWTDDGNCFGDPVPSADPEAKFGDFGWLPWQTIEPDDDGRFPNVLQDADIRPGLTYTYTVVAETQGAEFRVLQDNGGGALPTDDDGNAVCVPARCGPGEVSFAPPLTNPLSRSSSEPNVLSAYVPVSRAAGERAAEVEIERVSGTATAPFDVVFSGRQVEGGTYRAVFGDRIDVMRAGDQTTVRVMDTETVVGPGEETASLAVFGQQEFTTTGEVTLSGDGAMIGDMTRFGFGMVLVDDGGNPLLVTTTLGGATATPGSFLSRSDFPYFVVTADNSVAGEFAEQDYAFADGRDIAVAVEPTIRWLDRETQSVSDRFGEYVISWAGEVYGPNSPFDLTGDLQARVDQSMGARPSVATSRADADALAALEAAGIMVSPEEVGQLGLPFTIQNTTYGNDVDVVVLQHQESVLLGRGGDTARVNVPAGSWVPGDALVVLETFEVDSTRTATDADGEEVTAVAVDQSGNPIRVTRTVATWQTTIGCANPRSSCNPTVAGGPREGGSGYVPTAAEMELTVHYYNAFDDGTEYVLDVTAPVLASDLPASEWDLSQVGVVPNPYRFFNEWEAGAPQVRFTHVPPEGRIRIYTVSGQFVQELNWTPEDLVGSTGESGDLPWNLQTRERTELAYGLYIWVLTTPDGRQQSGKFAVLR